MITRHFSSPPRICFQARRRGEPTYGSASVVRNLLYPSGSVGAKVARQSRRPIYRARVGKCALFSVHLAIDVLAATLTLLANDVCCYARGCCCCCCCYCNGRQSAGPRAGDLFGDPNVPSDAGYPEPQHGVARQHLHMTTGTAPAMMSTSPGAFLRDRETAGRGLGRRGAGGARGR